MSVRNFHILLDCGIRPRPFQNTPLYEKIFDFLDSWQDLKAVLISHAHLDHIGSLPKVFQNNKKINIFVPKGSLPIIKDQLLGSLTINNKKTHREYKEDYEVIQFAQKLVKDCLDSIVEIPFFQKQKIPRSNIYFEFWPAGHIISSASIFITTREGTFLYTGDICTYERMSVQNLRYKDEKVDYLLCESTYLYSQQNITPLEGFKDLFEKSCSVVEKGGCVLIPSFALGKAQEIASMFVNEIKISKKKIPVYLDGYVKLITKHYEKILGSDKFDVLSSGICKEMKRLPPNPDLYSNFIAHNPGSIIISSSGMLIDNSKSSYWAQAMASSDKNAIFFTGYLDEDSPGYKLLNAQETKEMIINRKHVDFSCELDKFYIGTHSHSQGIAKIIQKLSPNEVIFVHGYPNHRNINDLKLKVEKSLKKEICYRIGRNYKRFELSG